MYILNNAVKNLFRNKGRNIIIALIILAMLTFTAISMIINSATDTVIKNYKEQFGSEIYLTYDEEKIHEQEQNGQWTGITEITDDMKIKLADSEYLKETRIQVLYQAYSDTLKSVGQNKEFSSGENAPSEGGGGYYMPTLSIYGYNTPDLMDDFQEGKRKITSGKMFEKDGECVISEDFAKLNNLQIGDAVEIQDCAKDAGFKPLKLTIAGIFFDSKNTELGYDSIYGNPRNEILTTYNTMKNYQENVAKTRLYTVEATYFLKSPDLLDEFGKEAHEKGLPEVWKLATDEMSYNRIVKPAENLAGVSQMFLIGVLIVGSAVLILLSILSIRERKYEIGVQRTMGMKKPKVVRGILYESFITIALCLVIGLSIGAATAQPISDKITENQQTQSQHFGSAQVETEEIEVSLTADAALKVSGIAILLAVISSSAGVLYILRYEPMKILSERN